MHTQEQLDSVAKWLGNYTGDFYFFKSLQSQHMMGRTLSPKQVDTVLRAITRDEAYTAAKFVEPKAAPVYSFKVGDTVVLNKKMAKKIALAAGYAYPHHAMDVVEVQAETPRAVLVTVRLSAQRTSFCGCCGLRLSDPKSIVMGIGPICAGKRGLNLEQEQILVMLGDSLKVTKSVTTWIPKAAIKETKAA